MLDDIPFRYEVNEIITKGVFNRYNFLEATISDGKKTVSVLSVSNMNRYRDYIANFTQLLTITVTTTLADYEYLTLANTAFLKVTVRLSEIPQQASYSESVLSNPIEFTYKAKLMEINSTQRNQNQPMINNPEVARNTMKEFSLQLLEPGFESVSIKQVGGTFRGEMGVDIMRTLLTRFSTEDELDAITSVVGTNVIAGYNTDKKEQIVIPHPTPLTKAIQMVQENCGGVYPTGFSYFLQSNLWYIFPPYDLTLFNKSYRTITVVNLPKDRIPTIEKTYFNSATKLIVLSTRDSAVIDHREANTFNKGSSLRFVSADKFFEGFGQAIGNKLLINAKQNVDDVTLEEREDGANILRSDTVITSNKNIELSKLAKERGFYFQLIWENSDDSLLHPGMPAKILYLKDNKPASVTGTLVETETNWVPVEKNFKHVKLQRITALTFFVGDEKFVSE